VPLRNYSLTLTQRLRNVSLLPRWNNVSVKSTTAVSPREPKSCEVRFWLVEFYVCYVCCMTQQKACTQSCQLIIFQLGASPPFSLLSSLSFFFPLSVPFHAADCGAASPDPSVGSVCWIQGSTQTSHCVFSLKRTLLSGDNSCEFTLQQWLKLLFLAHCTH